MDFILFCGLDLFAPVPDATTRCRFQNALVQGGVHDDKAVGGCRQIEDHGPKR
ncbi:MAG: transposase [Rhodobacteraceae bacterium]|nr:transposase [Paracoccaceae bacterium]